jgi:hypothetical protein
MQARSFADTIVKFMELQLQKLSTATQEVLKLAACMGNQFDLATPTAGRNFGGEFSTRPGSRICCNDSSEGLKQL